MESIRNLVSATSADLRSGRETWRVMTFFCSCAFVISSVLALLRIAGH